MTIETLIPLDEIPDELKFFDRALEEYVKKHKLSNTTSLTKEQRDLHFRTIQEMAAGYGLMMDLDGTLHLPPPLSN